MEICLDTDDIDLINPCFILISFDGKIQTFGPFFRNNFLAKLGAPVEDLITFSGLGSFGDIISKRENVFDVSGVIPKTGLKVSGNLILVEQGFVYTARPSVNSLQEAIEAGLDMKSFGTGDPTYKMLLSGHMQQNLLEQYREIAAKLTEARRSLIEPIANMWELSAYIAHDFKNYLNAIAVSVDRIKNLEAASAQESFDLIDQALIQATSLADAIGDIARNQKHDNTTFELNRVLRANARIFASLLAKGIRTELDLLDKPLSIQCNIPIFIGCMMTIISNAKQALGESGAVKISTEHLKVDDIDRALKLTAKNYAVISIVDDGPGIPPHLLSQVTKPFVSTKGGGRGLGLASVAEFCRRQEGALRVESNPGAGSRIELILPLVSEIEYFPN
jgi:signal transduction histidine kinase